MKKKKNTFATPLPTTTTTTKIAKWKRGCSSNTILFAQCAYTGPSGRACWRVHDQVGRTRRCVCVVGEWVERIFFFPSYFTFCALRIFPCLRNFFVIFLRSPICRLLICIALPIGDSLCGNWLNEKTPNGTWVLVMCSSSESSPILGGLSYLFERETYCASSVSFLFSTSVSRRIETAKLKDVIKTIYREKEKWGELGGLEIRPTVSLRKRKINMEVSLIYLVKVFFFFITFLLFLFLHNFFSGLVNIDSFFFFF